MLWTVIERAIQETDSASFSLVNRQPVSGGCLHKTFVVDDGKRRYFVKLSDDPQSNILACEAHSLSILAATDLIRVPRVITSGRYEGGTFLVLEFLQLQRRDSVSDRHLGHRLGLLHRLPMADFGWSEDNYIGANPQKNTPMTNWSEFWRACRLGCQLRLARENGYSGKLQRLGERLLMEMDHLFEEHQPVPSLLHGDLWSGNAAALEGGEPVIFDPACYRGDREADLAMTELFAGFSRDFYAAYDEVRPRKAGYTLRRDFYNLYHVLNHLNLFGGGYLCQAEQMMERLLCEIV